MISTVCRRDHLRYCTYALPDCCRLTVAPHQTLKGVGGGGQLWSLCFNFVVFLTTSCYAGTYVVLASSVTIRHTLAISTCALIQKKTYFVWTCKVVEMHAPTTTRLLVHKATAGILFSACIEAYSLTGFILNLKQHITSLIWFIDVFRCLNTKNELRTHHQHPESLQSISTLT